MRSHLSEAVFGAGVHESRPYESDQRVGDNALHFYLKKAHRLG